jgi:hypothetical protein
VILLTYRKLFQNDFQIQKLNLYINPVKNLICVTTGYINYQRFQNWVDIRSPNCNTCSQWGIVKLGDLGGGFHTWFTPLCFFILMYTCIHPHTVYLSPTVNCHSKLTLSPGDIGNVCYPESDHFQNWIYYAFAELYKLFETNNFIECWQNFMKFATTNQPCIALSVCYNNKIIKVIICKFITGRNVRCQWTKFSSSGWLGAQHFVHLLI